MCEGTWLPLLGAASALGAYLLGSINSALIISKLCGLQNPREHGSGNPGATNMLRTTKSNGLAALTLMGDIGKGALAVWLALDVCPEYSSEFALTAAVGAVLGHVWPVFHGFRGGKGVATLAGVLAVSSPYLFALWVASWLVAYGLYRLVSVASITAAATLPLYAFTMYGTVPYVLAGSVLGALVVARHRDNLVRLWRGEESGPR